MKDMHDAWRSLLSRRHSRNLRSHPKGAKLIDSAVTPEAQEMISALCFRSSKTVVSRAGFDPSLD